MAVSGHPFCSVYSTVILTVSAQPCYPCLCPPSSELYGSPLGQRYKAQERDLVVGRPVVVLYTQDLNYYRALITARDDVTTYKVMMGWRCVHSTQADQFCQRL